MFAKSNKLAPFLSRKSICFAEVKYEPIQLHPTKCVIKRQKITESLNPSISVSTYLFSMKNILLLSPRQSHNIN